MASEIQLGIKITADGRAAQAEIGRTASTVNQAAAGMAGLGSKAGGVGAGLASAGAAGSAAFLGVEQTLRAAALQADALAAKTRSVAASSAGLGAALGFKAPNLSAKYAAEEQLKKLGSEASRAQAALDRLGAQGSAALGRVDFGKASGGAAAAAQGVDRLTGALARVGHYSAIGAGLYIGFNAAKGAMDALIESAARLDRTNKALDAVGGSADATAQQIAVVRGAAQDLGIGLSGAADGYVRLSASAQGTALAGEKTHQTFMAVARAGAALGLSSDEVNGALLAIGQMMSKGTVSAEELRGQLGERLPGAFNIAARAMGVSTAELGKMLEQGKVLAADFLPRFATELDATYSKARFDGIQNNINRIENAWETLKSSLAQAISLDHVVAAFAGAANKIAAIASGNQQAQLEIAQANLAALEKSPSTLSGAWASGNIADGIREWMLYGVRVKEAREQVHALGAELNKQDERKRATSTSTANTGIDRGEAPAVLRENTGAVRDAEAATKKLKTAQDALARSDTELAVAKAHQSKDWKALEAAYTAQIQAEQKLTLADAQHIAQNRIKTEQMAAASSAAGKHASAVEKLTGKYQEEIATAGLSARELAAWQAAHEAAAQGAARAMDAYRDSALAAFDAKAQADIHQAGARNDDLQTLIGRATDLRGQGLGGDALARSFELAKTEIEAARYALEQGYTPAIQAAYLATQLAQAKLNQQLSDALDPLKGVRERMDQSLAIIAATEQSLQSRVITGIETEATARGKLKTAIGEQAAALQAELVPQIQALMAAAAHPQDVAQLQAMIDKINELQATARQRGVFSGAAQGARDYLAGIGDDFQTARDAANRAFKGMEDALVEFVKTGKLQFGNLIDAMISDILRLALQRTLIASLAKIFDGFFGTSSGSGNNSEIPGGGSRRSGSAPQSVGSTASNVYDMTAYRRALVPAPVAQPTAAGGSNAGGIGNIKVVMENHGTPQRAASAQPTLTPEGLVIRIVTDDIRRGGAIGQAITGAFGTRRSAS